MPPLVRVDPEALVAAAAELDVIAAGLQTTSTLALGALRPLPAGNDEVSQLASRHFVDSAGSFAGSSGQAIAELREAAAALRVQAAEYSQVDTELATSLAPGALAPGSIGGSL